MKESEQIKLIDEVLTRGVGTFVDPEGTFKKKLLAKIKGEHNKDIIVKFGVDPTRPDIHLGHAVVLRKLRQLQELGCKVIFLIGDFTASIGDPTGKSKVRPAVEQATVHANMKTYLEQVGKILQQEKKVFSWICNSDWLTGVTDINIGVEAGKNLTWTTEDDTGAKRTIPITDPNSFIGKALMFDKTRMQTSVLEKKNVQVITLATLFAVLRQVTHAQLIERDLFQERLKSGESLFLNEMLYPVIQGIDSNVLARIYDSCDLEIGGTDQTFNMLMGRKTMEVGKLPPQSVLSMKILVGTDGKEKMSKSLDNYVGITDDPKVMFGKIMSIPDSAIASYFELCTFTPMDEVEAIKKKLKGEKINPRDLKMDLAQQVVEIYHGKKSGEEARAAFISTFQKKKLPEEIQEVKVTKGTSLVDALTKSATVASKTEFRRLIGEGAIREDGEKKLTDPMLKIESDIVLKVGKHRFVKIVVE
ncbi:MAG: tyrosine--tRNA ligase [bacterium]|nr:tyrosine--tRNA ligase [bacterium]